MCLCLAVFLKRLALHAACACGIMRASSSPLMNAMFRTLSALLLCLLLGGVSAQAAEAVTRCGWFHNPTPGNATLVDAAGEWIIGTQGGHQADGDWPAFEGREWVRTNVGSYGYGCACIKLLAKPGSFDVERIVSARVRPLQQCRRDAKLPRPPR